MRVLDVVFGSRVISVTIRRWRWLRLRYVQETWLTNGRRPVCDDDLPHAFIDPENHGLWFLQGSTELAGCLLSIALDGACNLRKQTTALEQAFEEGLDNVIQLDSARTERERK